MAKQPDDTLLQFLCIHRPATFTFGMPRGKARERAASISAQIAAAAGKDTADVRSDAEAVLRHNIEHGLHMDPGRQQEAATTILWLTLTGEAAKETRGRRRIRPGVLQLGVTEPIGGQRHHQSPL